MRCLSSEMITWGCWGHVGGALSAAEILACLYVHAMRVDPGRPDWDGRDRFVLSKAHASPAPARGSYGCVILAQLSRAICIAIPISRRRTV